MMLSLDTAYRSFGGEVEASSTPTICRLPDSRRHQLSAIARSPDLGVLSVSLTSTRSSDPSHLFGLAGPTSVCLNRMDLPCSRCFLWLHAGGTNPGSTSDRSRCRGLRFRLPL